VEFSVPDATSEVRSTRCLVSSSTTPNCSTARAPKVGRRNAAASRGLRNCTRTAATVRERPAPEFYGGQHLCGPCPADAADPREVVGG
jgi:hypothetical protein